MLRSVGHAGRTESHYDESLGWRVEVRCKRWRNEGRAPLWRSS